MKSGVLYDKRKVVRYHEGNQILREYYLAIMIYMKSLCPMNKLLLNCTVI